MYEVKKTWLKGNYLQDYFMCISPNKNNFIHFVIKAIHVYYKNFPQIIKVERTKLPINPSSKK